MMTIGTKGEHFLLLWTSKGPTHSQQYRHSQMEVLVYRHHQNCHNKAPPKQPGENGKSTNRSKDWETRNRQWHCQMSGSVPLWDFALTPFLSHPPISFSYNMPQEQLYTVMGHRSSPSSILTNLMFCWPCIVIYQYNTTNKMHYLPSVNGFGGLVVSVLASGSRVRGFKPGRSRWIFTSVKILSMPSFRGEVKVSVPCPSFSACKRT
jgi:hypothetical protein